MPGVKIPILGPSSISDFLPDVMLILPWNLKKEIKLQISRYQKSKIKTLQAIPTVKYC